MNLVNAAQYLMAKPNVNEEIVNLAPKIQNSISHYHYCKVIPKLQHRSSVTD